MSVCRASPPPPRLPRRAMERVRNGDRMRHWRVDRPAQRQLPATAGGASSAVTAATDSAASTWSACSEFEVGQIGFERRCPPTRRRSPTPRLSTGADGQLRLAATDSASLIFCCRQHEIDTAETLERTLDRRREVAAMAQDRTARGREARQHLDPVLGSPAARREAPASRCRSHRPRTAAPARVVGRRTPPIERLRRARAMVRSDEAPSASQSHRHPRGLARRPIRSTSCRHADCAPNGVDMSAESTVSRLSSKRKVASSWIRLRGPRRNDFLTARARYRNSSF